MQIMKYQIAYSYRLAGEITIEADSLEEAKEMALEASANNNEREFFLEGSFEVDEEETEMLNKVRTQLIN